MRLGWFSAASGNIPMYCAGWCTDGYACAKCGHVVWRCLIRYWICIRFIARWYQLIRATYAYIRGLIVVHNSETGEEKSGYLYTVMGTQVLWKTDEIRMMFIGEK